MIRDIPPQDGMAICSWCGRNLTINAREQDGRWYCDPMRFSCGWNYDDPAPRTEEDETEKAHELA